MCIPSIHNTCIMPSLQKLAHCNRVTVVALTILCLDAERGSRTLIFVQTKRSCDRLDDILYDKVLIDIC